MATEFDNYAAKGNEILNKLTEELQVPGDMALRILRAVLHATRDHLSIEESVQVLSQLPMAIKAIYADQWDATREIYRIHHLNQFLDEVRSYDKELAGYDFGNNESAGKAVKTVYKILSAYLSYGEFQDIIAVLPLELKGFIQESIREEVKG